VATQIFDGVLGERPNQVDRLRDDVSVSADDLLRLEVPGGEITEEGLRTNVSVGVRYIDAWLHGTGAAAIDNLMEDAATAEISRSQVWQWLRAGRFTRDEVRREVDELREEHPEAAAVFEEVALAEELVEFLTLVAYDRLG
jgi:malate synthase